MDKKAAVSAFEALSSGIRLDVFRLLVRAGPQGMVAGELASALDLPPTNMSFHLKALAQAGLVAAEQEGRFQRYRADMGLMRGLIAYLTEECCSGVPALCGVDGGAATTGFSPPEPGTKRQTESSMSDKCYNVLFLCAANSARSIIAEVILNQIGQGRFKAYSAGSAPRGEVHPMTLQVLRAQGYDTGALRSKSWEEFAGPDAPQLDFVFTVCDTIAGETCPVWPGQPMTAHWGVADPAAFEGSDEQKAKVFRDTALVLKRRIELMLALPLTSLDRMALQTEVRRIGRQ
jgi:protein-tyrosine-phosphatase/DNA-binding transcriptional ArsR family regulator